MLTMEMLRAGLALLALASAARFSGETDLQSIARELASKFFTFDSTIPIAKRIKFSLLVFAAQADRRHERFAQWTLLYCCSQIIYLMQFQTLRYK
uniref:Uncharacterized protein n=1 Tax=Romanomermis culicivorax TaxID=13658 RepID=A0A915HIW4_ROMCU